MIQTVEALRYVALDEPDRPSPRIVDFSECGVAPSLWSEPMRVVAELWLVIRIQQQADDLLQYLVRPHGDTKRAFLGRVGFLDVHAPRWLPLIPFISQSFNDGRNFLQ